MNRPRDFWSRRRAAVDAESLLELQASEEGAVALVADRDESDAETLGALGLPDPDTLVAGDDFRAFMVRSVPGHLRRRALRSLWTSNPVLANLDGLVDYADDYTDAAVVVPDLQTTYRVGKGLLRHLETLEAAEAEASEHECDAAPDGPPPDSEDEAPSGPADAEIAWKEPFAPDEGEAVDARPPPRRMAFRFEEVS